MKQFYIITFATLLATSSIMAESESEEPKSFVYNEKNCVDEFIRMTQLHGSLVALAQQNREIYRALNTSRGYEKDDNTAKGIKEAEDTTSKINTAEYEKTKAAYQDASTNAAKCFKRHLLTFVTKEQLENLKW